MEITIVTGILDGTVDFDFSATSSYTLTALNRDVFIARYSSIGNFIWAKSLKGALYYESSEPTIAIDKDGNIILTMRSDDKVDFNTDPSPAQTYYLSSAYNYTVATYLAKYDGNGNYIWAKKFDTEQGLYPEFIETDADGTIYLVGSYYYTQDFDLSSGSSTLYGSSQTSNLFLAKYNTSGGLLLAKVLINSSSGVGVAAMKLVNNEDIVLVGGYLGGNFNTTGPDYYLYGGSNGAYIAKYKTDGTFVCANSMYISSYLGNVNDVTVDSDGNMYAVGDFTEAIDFNGITNPGQVIAAKDEYDYDGFIVKYNSQAEVVWYFSVGSANNDDNCRAVAIDSKNDLIVTGLFTGDVDFDPSLASYKSLVNLGGRSIFIATYSLNKAYKSAKQLTFSPNHMEMERGMLITDSDEIMLRALAYDSTDIDPSSNTVLVHPIVSSDMAYYLSVYSTTSSVTTSLVNSDSKLFKAYPNPLLHDMLYITDLDNSVADAVPIVTSIEGKNIPFTYIKNEDGIAIEFNDLSKGVYFITIGESSVKIIR